MAATIPTKEPTEFAVGETVKWTKSLSDYPASSWTLTYYFRGPEYLDVTASADGDDHSVTIPSATSSALTAGNYWWEARVTDGSETYRVDSGRLTVKADLSLESAGYDGRSVARVALEAIEAVIKQRATRDDLNYTLPGVGMTVSKIPPEDLLKWYDYFKAEVVREERAEKIANGEGSGQNIYVRFGQSS